MQSLPEVVCDAQPSRLRFETSSFDVNAAQTCFVQHRLGFVCVTVNELGAKLDRVGNAWLAVRHDAAANAVPCFEHGDAQAGIVQFARGSQPGYPGPDDDDIGTRSSSHIRPWSKRRSRISV